MTFKLFGKTVKISKKLTVAVLTAFGVVYTAKTQGQKVPIGNLVTIALGYLGAQGLADAAANFGSSTPPNPPVVTNPEEAPIIKPDQPTYSG
jgi:hypothetical protein